VRRAEIRLAVLIAALVMLDLMVMLLAVPLVPRWERTAHLSHLQSGMVLGAYATAVLFLSLPAGHLADRLGPRRLTVAATILFAATTPGYAFADSFVTLVALRFTSGVFSAVGWTAGLAWLVSSIPAGHRLRAVATVNASASAAAVAGPLIGGPVVAWLGLTTTMLVVSAIVAGVAVWTILEPTRPPPTSDHDTGSPITALRAGWRNTTFRQAHYAIIFIGCAAGALQLLVPIHLHATGLSDAAIGWVFTAGSALSVGVAVVVGRRAERIDRRRTAQRGCVGVAVITAFLAFDPPTTGFNIGVVVFFGFATLLWTTVYPMCSQAADDAGIGQGIALGLLNTAWAAAAMTAPVLAGLTAEHASTAMAFAMWSAAGVLTAAALRRRIRRHDPIPRAS
jgi:predicted MFS family arabinose efflux permease